MHVYFPGLWGLEFYINNWAFQVFGIKIYWYGIIIALAFLLAVMLAMRSCKSYGLVPDNVLDLVLFTAPAAIVCARLYFVMLSWDQFKDNLMEIFNTRNGGLAVYGGVIGAFIVVMIYAKYKKIPFLQLFDFGVPYLALGQAVGRWGNFINQEAFGYATNLPWRMNGDIINSKLGSLQPNIDLSRFGAHPTFLYESLLDFAIFLFLAFYRKKKKVEGEVLFLYLILYGAGRFLIEGLRTDSLMLGPIRVSQLLSLLLVVLFVFLFIYRRIKMKHAEDEEPVDLGQSQYGSLLIRMKEEEMAEMDGNGTAAYGEKGTGEEKAGKEGSLEEGAAREGGGEEGAGKVGSVEEGAAREGSGEEGAGKKAP